MDNLIVDFDNLNVDFNKLNYSELSKTITTNLTKKEKKDDGIYFTPPSCIHKNLELLKPYFDNIKTILEPACGSCEYINGLCQYNKNTKKEKKEKKTKKEKNLEITGIEFNKKIYDSIQAFKSKSVNLLNQDFLTYKTDKKYDLIIGNPPYYVMKKKEVDKEYYPYFDGRPNIFILFIIKSFKFLANDGLLSFILPKNFTNCLCYDKTRKYINNNFQIIDIVDCNNKFIETSQATIIFIVKKQQNIDNSAFILDVNDYTIIGNKINISKLKTLYTSATNLNKLGFNVSVGTVVWNQHKDILTVDATKTRLIYSSDIKDNKLVMTTYSNEAKKNYIDKDATNQVMLVVNRGYGVGNYKFNYCLIDVDFKYLVENHLICIKYDKPTEKKALLEMFARIIESLEDARTADFINTYFGNNAINTTELNCILPIYKGASPF